MSLINTRMQNMRVESPIDKYEYRPSVYGAYDAFKTQTDDPTGIITPELKQKAAISIGNTLQVPVIDYDGGISISSTRTTTIAASENTSQLMTITFSTYSFGFTMVPAMFSNNEISMQRDFNAKMTKYINKLASTLDLACVSALSLNKTAVFGETLAYTEAGNMIKALWTQREELIGDLNPLMKANDFFDQIHLVGNMGTESIIRKLSEKGLYNETNKQYQFNDKILHFTNGIHNATDAYCTGYAINAGSLGMLTRFEREAVLGTKSRDGHEWGIDNLPMLNLPCGTYFYDSVEDMNAIAGAATTDLTRARVDHYGFSVDVALVIAYNSDATTKAQPIMKFNILKENAS
jgi:hypothetical protein